METPLHVVIRMELDEGCETGGNVQSVPSISKQHNISGEIGSVTTNGMASPGVMPGNTDINPGVFTDMTRNTRLDSLAFDYVDQGTAGGGLQGQEFGSFSDRGYDQSTRGCGLQGIHVGSDTGHSTQDSGGSVQEILWSKCQGSGPQHAIFIDQSTVECGLQGLHRMQVGSFSDQDSIQSPDGSQQEFSLANMHRKDVGQAVGLTGHSISLSEPLHAVLNHNLEDFATHAYQVEKHLQSVAASNGNQRDSVDQYTGGSGLRAASIGHSNQMDESQGLSWNTKQDDSLHEGFTERGRQEEKSTLINVNVQASDSILLNNLSQHQRREDARMISMNQHPGREDAGMISMNQHQRREDVGMISMNQHPRRKDAGMISMNQHPGREDVGMISMDQHQRRDDAGMINMNQHQRRDYAGMITINQHPRRRDAGIISMNQHPGREDAGMISMNQHQRRNDARMINMNQHPRREDAGMISMNQHPMREDAGMISMNQHLRGDAGMISINQHQRREDAGMIGMNQHPGREDVGMISMNQHPRREDAGMIDNYQHSRREDFGLINVNQNPGRNESRGNSLNRITQEDSHLSINQINNSTSVQSGMVGRYVRHNRHEMDKGLDGYSKHHSNSFKPNVDIMCEKCGSTSRSMFPFKHKKVSSYDGGTSWQEYIVQFEMISQINGWDDHTKVMELATSLKGPALTVMVDLDPGLRNDYSALVNALNIRFGSLNSSELYRVQLKSRIKKKSESLAELAQDIKHLTGQAYPLYPTAFREPLALEYFMDALSDRDMKWNIYKGKPKCLDGALQLATEYEVFQIAAEMSYQARFSTTKDTQGEYISVMGERTPESFNGPRNKKCRNCRDRGHNTFHCSKAQTCFGCGEEGHFKRDCPKLRR